MKNLTKDNIVSFCWQHLLLIISLFVMTMGVAVCVRSCLGCSVISVLPYVFATAGTKSIVPDLTIGQYTWIMNAILVAGQILILRKRFKPAQLLQLVIGFFFGTLLDISMYLTEWLAPVALWQKIIAQFIGCCILGIGISFEVRCGSVTMPGEGISVAVSIATGMEFPKAKIRVDITLVVLGIIACFGLLGAWQWQIIGPGTLFAMLFVGIAVKRVNKLTPWFSRVLQYRPGFRRYIFGLARYIRKK